MGHGDAQLGDHDGRFDFETATHIRETVIARRTNAKKEAGATKHMSSYGREFGDESSSLEIQVPSVALAALTSLLDRCCMCALISWPIIDSKRKQRCAV